MNYLKKWNLILLLIISFIFFTENYSSSKSAVKWYDFDTGMRLAKKNNKTIVISFFANWCYYCKTMDKTTFSDSKVVSKLTNYYIPVRVNVDSNDKVTYKKNRLTSSEFSSYMGVRGLPTIVFMNKNEELITTLPGYIKVDMFLQVLGYIKEECYNKKVSFEDYASGKSKCK